MIMGRSKVSVSVYSVFIDASFIKDPRCYVGIEIKTKTSVYQKYDMTEAVNIASIYRC